MDEDDLLLVCLAEDYECAFDELGGGALPGFPPNGYILEDASQFYITEDALTIYVTEA